MLHLILKNRIYNVFIYKSVNVRVISIAIRKTNTAMETWMELWMHLTVVYRDGVKIEGNEPGTDHGGDMMGGETGKVTYGTGIGNGEWPDSWK